MENKRYAFLDIAKGIAIIAVVLGHCFPDNLYSNSTAVEAIIAKLIYGFCYTWHMPLFFFISGFLFFNTWKSQDKTKIIVKAKRLLIPYLTFSIVYIPLRLFMPNMANSNYSGYWKIFIGISPNGGVWYLYVLFLFIVFSMIIIRNNKVLITFCIIGIVFNVLSHSGLQVEYSVLRYTCIYFVFFGIGLLWREKLNNYIRIKISLFVVIVQLVIYILLFLIQELYGFESLNIICGLIGINIVLILSVALEKSSHGKGLQRLGSISMSVYLLHGPILVVLRSILVRVGTPVLLASALMLFCSIFFSIIVDKYILHINHIFEFIFLGIEKNKKEAAQ